MTNLFIYIPYGIVWSKDPNFLYKSIIYSHLTDKSYNYDDDLYKELVDMHTKLSDGAVVTASMDYHLSLTTSALERMIGNESETLLNNIESTFKTIELRLDKLISIKTTDYSFSSIPYMFMNATSMRLWNVGKVLIAEISSSCQKYTKEFEKLQRLVRYNYGMCTVSNFSDIDDPEAKLLDINLAKLRNYHMFDNNFIKFNPYIDNDKNSIKKLSNS